MEMLSWAAGCLLTVLMWSHYGFQLEENMSSKMAFSCEHMAKALTQTACICLDCKWRILKENLAIWTTSVLMELLCISGTVFVISVLMSGWEKCPESECEGSPKAQIHNRLLKAAVAKRVQLLGARFIHRL